MIIPKRVLLFLLCSILLSILTSCSLFSPATITVTAPADSSSSPATAAPMPSSQPSVVSIETTPEPSNVSVALDYICIHDTHWISQIGGYDKAGIQIVVILKDDTGVLSTWPPNPENQLFYMNFFETISIKENTGGNPILYTGPVKGTLSVGIVAYNTSKGAITKSQIDIVSMWRGADFSILKEVVPDKELVGSYWQTWLPANNWGIGNHFTNEHLNENMTVWGRIGTGNNMPQAIPMPVITPDVEIAGQMPANARTREYLYYNYSDFSFTLRNNEAFSFPIYWRIETDSNPGTTINYIITPTQGSFTLLGGGLATETGRFWFDNPGDFYWRYVAEYPKGTPIASWEGTLHVSG